MASIYRRGDTWYIKYNVPGKLKPTRKSLETTEKKIAEAKLAIIVSSLNSGDDSPFPTKSPIPQVLESFIQHSYSRRDTACVNKDLSNLRKMFGIVCPSLAYSNERIADKKAARSKEPGQKDWLRSPLGSQMLRGADNVAVGRMAH